MTRIVKIMRFLGQAQRHGYQNKDVKPKDEPDGSHTIEYQEGDWRYHDNYFGGEPFGGREVVFFQGKAVWMMVYYGSVTDGSNSEEAIRLLRQALMLGNINESPRGPKTLDFGEGKHYHCQCSGDYPLRFQGHESITGRARIYAASFAGGLIDQ